MCSVGELRAGEEGSGPDLTGDNAGAAQRVEVLPRMDDDAGEDAGNGGSRRLHTRRMNSMNPNRKYTSSYAT
jgi:hypothetical protein